MPLLDKDGTTIALVNTANVNSPPETTFTYDPSGVSTVTGLSNSFPFLYQGLEHEVSDPGQLYFEPSGNVYNPQLQRELSLIGPEGILGPPSGFGNGGFSSPGGHAPGSQAGESLQQTFSNLRTVFAAASLASPSGWFPFSFSGFGSEGSGVFSGSLPIPFLGNLLCFINCGSSNGDQPTRHPHSMSQTYEDLGILLISQKSAASSPKSPAPSYGVAPMPPLRKDKPPPEYRKQPSASFVSRFSNCIGNSIAGGALPCYAGICGAGIGLFARGQKVIGGIAAGAGCGAAAATIFCCVGQGFGSDAECPTAECPSDDREKGGDIY